MADIAGPQILAVVRPAANGAWIAATYQAGASGYTRVYWWVRELPSGAWRQATVDTNLTGSYTITSIGGQAIKSGSGYEVRANALHSSGAVTGWSNGLSVPAWQTNTPTLESATRTGAGVSRLQYSGAAFGTGGATIYVERRPTGGQWAQVTAFQPTAASGHWDVSTPSDLRRYEFRIRGGQWSVYSGYSTTRSVDVWWQQPVTPGDFTVNRNSTTGTNTAAWTSTPTSARDTPSGFRVYRTTEGTTMPATPWRTLNASARAFTDTTADIARAWVYEIEAFNAFGNASSRPRASVGAARLVPNAASGLSVSHLGGNVWRISWSITPTTERPVTSQQLLGRVPGTTTSSVVATVGATTTQVDLDLGPNRDLEIAARPRNSVGPAEATSNWAGPVTTTPTGPSRLTAVWGTTTSVTVSWPSIFSVGEVLELEFSTLANPDRENQSHWLPMSSVSGWQDPPLSTSHAASPLVPHTYRGRALDVASGLFSSWVYSARLDAQAAPLAPTVSTPVSYDATWAVFFPIRHNPVDNTDMTDGQYRFRLQGASSWFTYSFSNVTRGGSIPGGTYANGAVVEVQARTQGGSGVWGPWSDSLVVELEAKPVVVIDWPYPGTHTSQDLFVEWTVEPSDTILVSSRVIIREDPPVGQAFVIKDQRFGPGTQENLFRDILENGKSYSVEVQVWNPKQGSDGTEAFFSVEYDLPAPPTLTALVRDSDAGVTLQATPRSSLQTLRVNHARRDLSDWQYIPGQLVTLQDGTSARQLDSSSDARLILDAEEGSLATLALDMAWGEEWSGINRTVTATMFGGTPQPILDNGNPAVLPTFLRGAVTAEVGPSSAMWSMVGFGYIPTGETAYYARPLALITPPGEPVPEDLSFFDGDTVRSGFVYGWNPDGTAWEAVPSSTGDRDMADTIRMEIWMSEDGVNYERLGDTLSDWSYDERFPRIRRKVWFRARAYAMGLDGAWADSDPVEVQVESCDTHIAWGDDFLRTLRGGFDPANTGQTGRRSATRRYIGEDGEDRIGVVWGSKFARKLSTSVTIRTDEGDSPLDDWIEASETRGPVVYRDPGGRVYVGPITAFTWGDDTDTEQSVSFEVTKIRERP